MYTNEMDYHLVCVCMLYNNIVTRQDIIVIISGDYCTVLKAETVQLIVEEQCL